jgi:hypothetical protein
MGFFSNLWDRGLDYYNDATNFLDWGTNLWQYQQNKGISEHQFRQAMDWEKSKFAQNQLFNWNLSSANRQQQYRMWANDLSNTIRQAKAHGISPLVALGKNAMPGPGGSHGMSQGSPVYGQTPRMFRSDLTGSALQMAQAELTMEKLKQEKILTKKMRNPAGPLPAGYTPHGGSPAGNSGTVNVNVHKDDVVTHEKGVTPGHHAMWKKVDHPDGGVSFESRERLEPEESPTLWIETEGRKLLRALKGQVGMSFGMSWIGKKKLARELMHFRKQLPKLPPGIYWQWSLRKNRFYPRHGNKFFLETHLVLQNGQLTRMDRPSRRGRHNIYAETRNRRMRRHSLNNWLPW